MFALIVQCTGRFVEEKNLGIFDQRSRNGDVLLLPARELGALVADSDVVTLKDVIEAGLTSGNEIMKL